MGTLVFHILLFSVFLLAEVDMKGSVREEILLIEFPEILPEEEEKIQEEEKQEDAEPIASPRTEAQTNVGANRLSTHNNSKSSKDFLDDDYLKEVEAAERLRSNVNSQLSKEIVDLNDIKMPVETTEGMDPDSIKNKNYTGESNIEYYLTNRYHLSLPIPVYLTQRGGKVVVDIVVNRQGAVVQAEPRLDKKMREEPIFLYSKAAALRTVFNADASAPAAQKGTIHYTFVRQ